MNERSVHSAAALLVFALALSASPPGGADQADPAKQETPDMTAPIALRPGTTLVPLRLPEGSDFERLSTSGRRLVILLRGVRADAPSGGGFAVRLEGHPDRLGDFTTFSLVGKIGGEDRVIVPADPMTFLTALEAQWPNPRLTITSPTSLTSRITIDAAELIAE